MTVLHHRKITNAGNVTVILRIDLILTTTRIRVGASDEVRRTALSVIEIQRSTALISVC